VGKKCEGSVRCDAQVEKIIDKAGKAFEFCRNCRYPERVYFDPQGGGKGVEIPAFRIALDVNSMRPVDKTMAKICKTCGRTFKSSKSVCNLCGFANLAADGNLTDEQKSAAAALYKEYAHILPLSWRCFGGKKYCFEDDGMIVFVIGKNKYRFDKLTAKSTGILKAARKM
jgi:hypothetical protein